jgi:predicted NBD/HSP70 family sugar kinase
LTEKYIQKEFFYMTNEKLSCDEIAELAREGDPQAKLIFKRQAMALGFAFNSIISLLNSEKIVIFGEFTKYLDLILSDAQKVVYDLQYGYCPQIVISELQSDAAAVGATLCAGDRVISKLEFSEN